MAAWIGIRHSRAEELLAAALRGRHNSDDAEEACAAYLQKVEANPQLTAAFGLNTMSLDQKLARFQGKTRNYFDKLAQLTAVPTNFDDGIIQLAYAVGKVVTTVSDTVGLGLAVLFPDLDTLDDRMSAFYTVAQARRSRPPGNAVQDDVALTIDGNPGARTEQKRTATRTSVMATPTEAPAESPSPRIRSGTARPVGERRANPPRVSRGSRASSGRSEVQRCYDQMHDRDKVKTYDLAMWTRTGGAMPMPRTEANRLLRLLFPRMSNPKQLENTLRLALKQRRLVIKDKRHQVSFLTTAEHDD